MIDTQNPNGGQDPGTPPPGSGSGGSFYTLAYQLPDGTAVYQDGAGNLVTNQGGQWVPFTGAKPSGPTVSTPPGTPIPPGAPTPPPPGGGPGPSGPSPFSPFNVPYQPLSGTPGSWTPFPNAPTFNAPTMGAIPTWTDPTADQAAAQPGYQFAAQQGEQALQQSQAAQGLANTGGSLKDILAWGQNYATQNYGNVRNQMKDTFNTNVQNQIVTPYQNAYKTAQDTFAGQEGQWQTQEAAVQRQNEFLTNTAFQKWLQDYNIYNGARNTAFNLLTAQ